MKNNVNPGLRRQVAERAYHVCEYCLIHEDDTFWGFETDHIISRKHEGPTILENLAWTCACCNRNKGTDVGTVVEPCGGFTRLFHPRRDAWTEHFVLHQVEIEGLNDVGTGTARLLKLNEDARLKERQSLRLAGRYPTIEALARMKE
jgi:hypothetical protein